MTLNNIISGNRAAAINTKLPLLNSPKQYSQILTDVELSAVQYEINFLYFN